MMDVDHVLDMLSKGREIDAGNTTQNKTMYFSISIFLKKSSLEKKKKVLLEVRIYLPSAEKVHLDW